MNIKEQIKDYITTQPEPKQSEMQELHKHILKALPKCKLWYFDGKDSNGKTVAYPTIGYGFYTINYANGTTRDFFQIGMGANPTGLFVHIMGLKDKTYLTKTYGKALGKASTGSYAIKFKTMKDINIDILIEAIRYGVDVTI